MNIFIVISPDKSLDNERIASSFPDHHHSLIGDAVWAVAKDNAIAQDIVEALRTDDDESILVVKADDYHGFAPRSIWQRFKLWEEA